MTRKTKMKMKRKKVRMKTTFTKRTSSTSKTLSVCKSITKELPELLLLQVQSSEPHGVLELLLNLSQHSLLRKVESL